MDKRKLRKALATLSLAYSEGGVTADVLIKACETYKSQTGFEESFDYDLLVAKSVFDALNGVGQDSEIVKALIPGQTKMMDGVMYVWSQTKAGSKTGYQWHVATKGTGAKPVPVGRSGKLTAAQVTSKQRFVNDLFPKDLKSLKVVKRLGGSTGAQLVEDVDGNQYVMKRGKNTNNDHVKQEYLANQLYNALGMRTPDYEMYDDNGDVVLLSRFIPMTRAPKASDYGEMAKGWIADCLLANWDVYQNDNCLIDAAGRVIRVDNGGSLEYRAQGAKKSPPYNDDILKTYKDMISHNQNVFSQLDDQAILDQIKEVKTKRDDVVNYLRASGEDSLANIVEKRFDNLKSIEDYLNKRVAAANRKVLPRQLMDAATMYRDFDDKELDDLWKTVAKGSSSSQAALTKLGNNGWELLSNICQARGFDARPRVVSKAEFWKFAAKAKNPIMFRGQATSNGISGSEYCDSFRYDDACFYGTYGIYSEGIYAHVDDTNSAYKQGASVNNKSTQTNYQDTSAYKAAVGYAGNVKKENYILKIAYEDDVNLIDLQDLVEEIKNNPPTGKTTPKIKKLQTELKEREKDWKDAETKLNNVNGQIRADVYKKMHYDEAAYKDMLLTIDQTDWGKKNKDGKPDYPSWDTFVLGNMANWVKQQGGTVKVDNDRFICQLPNSTNKFELVRYSYENNAIKQKNTFTSPYNYPVQRFEQWMQTQHVTKVQQRFDHELRLNSGTMIANLSKEVTQKQQDYYDKKTELDNEIKTNAPQAVYAAIYQNMQNKSKNAPSGLEVAGIYAALKGYDGIYRNNGNNGSHGYAIILNRSKCVVCKE